MYFHSWHFFKTYLALNPFWLHQFISSFFNFFLCNNKEILPLPKTLFISHNGHHEMKYKHFCFIKNIWWMFFHDMTFKWQFSLIHSGAFITIVIIFILIFYLNHVLTHTGNCMKHWWIVTEKWVIMSRCF